MYRVARHALRRRALLSVPASHQRRIDKARSLVCDTVVLDLEDGVAVGMKEDALQRTKDTLAQDLDSFKAPEVCVRINSVQSGLAERDLEAVLSTVKSAAAEGRRYLDGIVVPKVESEAELHAVAREIERLLPAEVGNTICLLASIESGRAVVNLQTICGGDHRLRALIMASEDYCADVGMTRTAGLQELLYARSAIVNHAAAFSLQAIDLVCMDFRDEHVLRAECINGVGMGFTGKQAIHPDQISAIQEMFSPSEKAVKWATRIMEAHQRSEAAGYGAFELDGKMIDEPVVKQASRLMARASMST